MSKIYLYFKFIFALLRVSKNPQNTQAVFDLSRCLRNLGLFKKTIEHLNQDPQSSQFLTQRRLMSKYKLDDLDQLPAGTLGKTYAQHMMSNKLNPDFYEVIDITDDVTYFTMCMRETHDIWHVVSGFGIDVPGELGLQAFTLAQTYSPVSTVLVGGAMFLAPFKNLNSVSEIYNQVTKGWTLGSNAKTIFGTDWEKLWDKPLDQIRRDFNVNL